MKNSSLPSAAAIILLALSLISLEARSQNSQVRSLSLTASSMAGVEVSFELPSWSMEDVTIGRENLAKISMEGSYLPNDEGAPDLPSLARYFAFPKGSVPRLQVSYSSIETIQNIELAPAPRIPKTTDDGPLHYEKDMTIWAEDSFYPAQTVSLSEPMSIRGVDVAILGISPFQYNPVTKELKVYNGIQVEVIFEASGRETGLTVGDDRLRSRFWDPLLKDMVINSDIIPQVDHQAKLARAIQSSRSGASRNIGCEYLIIVPDQPEFIAWADTLKRFRNEQGIMTDVLTTTDIGGNTVSAIEDFVDTAYYTWDLVPAAILLLGDYGTGNAGIMAPIWNNYCASDNIYADANEDDMPDIVFSRMTAQNATHLETMIGKILDYETDPPTNADYYDHPITALGWQTERWFQICIEVVGGFFRNELNKNPIRINEVYDGNPATDPWSTAPNTNTVMNYFGQNGLGYIPQTPGELGDWDGGNAAMINNAINDGSFLMLHRDHGYELGWGEPAYSNNSMSGLNNDDPVFVYSVNCLTGMYNWSGECFTEAFHRYPQRAIGLIAASEVSYSFVNDTYVWGAFDNMWPEFMPDYASTPEPRGLYTSFSNAAGKYFLQQSGWPYNAGSKEVTYNLFHHHGDAFNELYSEVPQELVVLHNGVIIGGLGSYTVQADTLSWIALSVDGEIIGMAQGTGFPVEIAISPQNPGIDVKLVVTKTNHFRYEMMVPVIDPDAPYVVYENHQINDSQDNGNGLIDYGEVINFGMTMQNIGLVDAQNVVVTLSSEDAFVVVTDSTEEYGLIAGSSTITLEDAFQFQVADTVPDGHSIFFNISATDGDTTWNSQLFVTSHAPVLKLINFEIDDSQGDGNGYLDPGEIVDLIVTVQNTGSADAFGIANELLSDDNYISINTSAQNAGDLAVGDSTQSTFSVSADEYTPGGFIANFLLEMNGDLNISGQGQFTTLVGQYSTVIIDLDPRQNSGPIILEAFGDMDLYAHYQTQFPESLEDYKSVFLSLGIQFSNYELKSSEASMLADFLNNEGKLYMEGRTTWYDDPQTILHPMFNVEAVYDNWFVLDTLSGQNETFTEGMIFSVDAVNPYNKYHLEPVAPAFEIFSTTDNTRGTWVAYDEGTYKTIAASTEFGGLVDGEEPSTKENLLEAILEFFGDMLTDIEDDEFVTRENISVYPNPFRDNVVFSFILDQKSEISLEVFNLTGQKEATVFEGILPSGNHQLSWRASGSSAGLYFYRLKTNRGIMTGKMMRK
jgi:uncharacterized repeat protein (TIGR01451 family)